MPFKTYLRDDPYIL